MRGLQPKLCAVVMGAVCGRKCAVWEVQACTRAETEAQCRCAWAEGTYFLAVLISWQSALDFQKALRLFWREDFEV